MPTHIMRKQNHSRYWKRLGLALWLLCLVAIPSLFAITISAPSALIAAALFATSGLLFTSDRLSFRVGMGALLAFALFYVSQPQSVRDVFAALNFRVQDAFFHLRGPLKGTGRVVIVDIDQRSLEEEGQWPWPVRELTWVIKAMKEDGVRVIGCDMLLDGPKRLAIPQDMASIVYDEGGVARYYRMMTAEPSFEHSLMSVQEGASVENRSRHTQGYPSLALEMFRAANGFSDVELGRHYGQQGVWLRRDPSVAKVPAPYPDEYFVPLEGEGNFVLNFLGYGGAWQPQKEFGKKYYFTYVSFADVLHRRFVPGTFKDKYVIIGSTDPIIGDFIVSPFRPDLPSVEVHATVLENILSGRVLVKNVIWERFATFLGILLLGSVLTIVVAFAPTAFAGLTSFILLCGLPSLSYWGLSHGYFVFDFVYPWLCVPMLSAIVVFTNFFVEGRERQLIVSLFSNKVSPAILNVLRDDPKKLSLSGQRMMVTVMFTDIEGFTKIAEQLAPEDLVDLLNDYFTPMSDIILKHDGFIDKFVGDAIMGCWGVPLENSQHALQACYAALEQQTALETLAGHIKQKYGVDISVRMGITSGEVSAALMGSHNSKYYTIMGDPVNLGARLEPACGQYGVKILLSEMTYQLVHEYVEVRYIDSIPARGRGQAVPVYELLGKKGEVASSVVDKSLSVHWNHEWASMSSGI